MNWLDQLYVFFDDIQALWSNPGLVLQRLQSDHILLLEVVAAFVVLLFLLYVLFKPTKKNKELMVSSTVQKANERIVASKPKEPKIELPKDSVPKTVKAVQEEGRQKQLAKQQVEGNVVAPNEPHEPSWQELSNDEEAALTEAMQNAGKQALAEIKGAPHQVAFFEDENAARDAAKKMFSKMKIDANDASLMQMPLKKAPPAPRLDFLMLYYMAPRSQPYKVFNLFNIFESFNLTFNDSQVFEYEDQQGLQFYIASALNPGTFDSDRQGEVVGLSFVLDLQSVQDARGAFNKMLIFIDALSKQLPGDILDGQRQRLTTLTMNEYLARIKNFNATHQ